MVETVGALVLAAATAGEATAAGSGIAGLGTLAGTTIGIGGVSISLATAVGATVVIGASIGLQYATRPSLPKPEDGAQALKQSIPSRQRGYGLNRLAGAYMLFEAAGPAPATSYDVIAFHSGRIGRIVQIYFSDDPVTPNADISHGGVATILGTYADERYSHDAIQVETRIGAPGQSALTSFVSDPLINHIWTAQHVGRGIAYMGIKCASGNDPALYTRVYPKGRPEASVLCECSPCWDPRDPAQHENDESTWLVSYNPVIQLIDYLTRSDGGMGIDRSVILPDATLALWMVEANICDAAEPIAGGGVERRYESSGWYQFDNKGEDVIGQMLATCDGHMLESGDGTLSLTVGLYRAPTDPPLTETHFIDFALNYGQADEQLVNQLDITFTDPGANYVSVQTEPWRDEAAISLTGIVRSQTLDLKWVQSNSQARRLADRAMQRLSPLMTGSFVTTLYGLRYFGKRWVPVQYPFASGMQDCIVEIQSAEVDLMAGRITWEFIRIAPATIEAYNPVTDEGTPPVVPPPATALSYLREDLSQYIREDGSTYVREA